MTNRTPYAEPFFRVVSNRNGTAYWSYGGYANTATTGTVEIWWAAASSSLDADAPDDSVAGIAYDDIQGTITVLPNDFPLYFCYVAKNNLSVVVHKSEVFGPVDILFAMDLTVTDVGGGAGDFVWTGFDLNVQHPTGQHIVQYSTDNATWDTVDVTAANVYTLNDFPWDDPGLYYIRVIAHAFGGATVKTSNTVGPIRLVTNLRMTLQPAQNTAVGLSTNKNVFTSYNHDTSSYTRNGSNWLQVDMTAHCVWSTTTGKGGGIAVSPLHLLAAAHYGPNLGATVRFVTGAGAVVERTVTRVDIVGGTDVRLCTLSSALPGTITPAKVLGPDYLDYLPDFLQSSLTPHYGLYISSTFEIIPVAIEVTVNGHDLDVQQNTVSPQSTMYETPVTGDSGAPVCFAFGGGLVVLTTLYTSISGPTIMHNHHAINSLMDGSGYQLTIMDYTGYYNYG
jgi:hypothetical protein